MGGWTNEGSGADRRVVPGIKKNVGPSPQSQSVEALAPAIRSADEIIFNLPPTGIWPKTMTASEFDLIVKEEMLSETTFITGQSY
jgi:hypothetical protein